MKQGNLGKNIFLQHFCGRKSRSQGNHPVTLTLGNIEQFHFDQAADDSTEIPSFTKHDDGDFSITNEFNEAKSCDGSPISGAHSCTTNGLCKGAQCRSCTGSVNIQSDGVGFLCDNPPSVEFLSQKKQCRDCFGASSNKCDAPEREFRGKCVPKPSQTCEKVARDAAVALSLAAATSYQELQTKVEKQLTAAKQACSNANKCEWATHMTKGGAPIHQGCFAEDATPSACRKKSETDCSGNCEFEQGNA